jgi:hypothetical protein
MGLLLRQCFPSLRHVHRGPHCRSYSRGVKASPAGLSKNQISRLFHGHVEHDRIDAALEQLVALGALSPQSEPTGGRPSTLWSALKEYEYEESDESEAEEENPLEEE